AARAALDLIGAAPLPSYTSKLRKVRQNQVISLGFALKAARLTINRKVRGLRWVDGVYQATGRKGSMADGHG
ncbi:hypothetical protein P5705_25835, partial [Pseudomonas entomophila]|uniref:hypothetical protein n=1 Tax=Pseudomonas entomophila TaxID=312306 RepID=UPI002405C402